MIISAGGGFEGKTKNTSCNGKYTEEQLGIFTNDVRAHLALQVYGCDTDGIRKIKISPSEVLFDSFEKDEMNTVRQVLTLLVVAISDYDDELLLQKGVVKLSKNSVVDNIHKSEGGDLFEHFPVTSKIYCLYRAYHLLTNKLSERNTPLFRVLYICVCLELWRLRVPAEVIAGPVGKGVHWGDLILQLTTRFHHTENSFPGFINFLKDEVNRISQNEVPDNVINHFYNLHGIHVREELSLVQGYFNGILRK